VFRLGSWRVDWVTLTLQTIGHEHRDLQRITIEVPPSSTSIPAYIYPDVGRAVGEEIFGQWLDLDRFLVHLRDSRSIHVGTMRPFPRGDPDFVDCIRLLLPGIAEGGD